MLVDKSGKTLEELTQEKAILDSAPNRALLQRGLQRAVIYTYVTCTVTKPIVAKELKKLI